MYNDSLFRKSSRFNFVMLYVNEEVSIARQLARGAAIRAQNRCVVVRYNSRAPLLDIKCFSACR